MTQIRVTPKVARCRWSFDGCPREAALKLRYGAHYLIIPMTVARQLVDLVHDAADDHDREQREGHTNDR